MQRIRTEFLPNPDFEPSVVAKASSAAEGLCKWVKAIEIYDKYYRNALFIFNPTLYRTHLTTQDS